MTFLLILIFYIRQIILNLPSPFYPTGTPTKKGAVILMVKFSQYRSAKGVRFDPKIPSECEMVGMRIRIYKSKAMILSWKGLACNKLLPQMEEFTYKAKAIFSIYL